MYKANSIFKFGKYKGRTIEEVWTGTTPLNENDIFRKYIIELCSFLLENHNLNQIIPSSSFDLTICSNELLFFSQSSSSKQIEIENNRILIKADDEKINAALFKTLSGVLTNSFIGKKKYYYKNAGEVTQLSRNSLHLQFLQANPAYIKWCFEEVESFIFSSTEYELLNSKTCNYFSHFDLSKITENEFYYKPIFTKSEYKLPEEILIINNTKFSNRFRTNRDEARPFEQNDIESQSCSSCHESPCMCSDREGSSSIYDY